MCPLIISFLGKNITRQFAEQTMGTCHESEKLKNRAVNRKGRRTPLT